MSLRRRARLVCVAALLGASALLLPALAVSETTPTVNALAPYSWSPAKVAITPGGVIMFRNSSAVQHGIIWTSSPAPACDPGIPVGAGHFSSSWSGACSFANEGVYSYECSYHMALMRGTVFVNATGTLPGAEPPPKTPATEPPAQSVPTAPPGAPAAPAPAPTVELLAGSPLIGAPAQAIKLRADARRRSVRGTIDLSPAGAHGRLEVDLLAASPPLPRVGHSRQVRVGRLLRASLPAGLVHFSVALDSAAIRALERHGRLALRVRLTLTPMSGAALRVLRQLVIR